MNTLNQVTSSTHSHIFLSDFEHNNERKVWLVIALTLATMIVEIIAGKVYGSMSLLADGWHMFTHAGAMLITALAYSYARRNALNPRFTFGTGKLNDLAGFSSALILALIALMIGFESFMRLFDAKEISFDQSILVAIIGLSINLFCAYLLRENHDHNHHHHHDNHHNHVHEHQDNEHQDNNLRAAYLHVITDALTSVLAIVALILGRSFGLVWLDPVIGIIGALIIANWSLQLMRDTSFVLLDASSESIKISNDIAQIITAHKADINDLHVWKVGNNHFAAIISLANTKQSMQFYKELLQDIKNLTHVTIEIGKFSKS